jgi:hypothetical protein
VLKVASIEPDDVIDNDVVCKDENKVTDVAGVELLLNTIS